MPGVSVDSMTTSGARPDCRAAVAATIAATTSTRMSVSGCASRSVGTAMKCTPTSSFSARVSSVVTWGTGPVCSATDLRRSATCRASTS